MAIIAVFSEHLEDIGYPEEGIMFVCGREHSTGEPCGCETFDGKDWYNQNGEIQNKCEIRLN